MTYHALVNVEINGTNQELLCFIVTGDTKDFYVLLAKFGDLFDDRHLFESIKEVA